VIYKIDTSMDMIIVNFTQQIFDDALFSLEEATKLEPNKEPFKCWKYCTWSIVASAMCMESFITGHLKFLEDQVDSSIWRSYERESIKLSGNKKGFFSKLKLIELITNSTIINTGDLNWDNIQDTIKLRNDIIHFNRNDIYNSINQTNAENGVKACKNLVEKIDHALNLPHPSSTPWITKTKSNL